MTTLMLICRFLLKKWDAKEISWIYLIRLGIIVKIDMHFFRNLFFGSSSLKYIVA